MFKESIKSLSPYSPGKPIEEVERELGITGAVKLASNENPLGPSPKAIAAIKKGAGEVNLYPDGGGYYLKNKLAEVHGLSPDNIILGNGSDELGFLAALGLLSPGDEAVISDGAFVRYKMYVTLAGGAVRSAKMKNYTHDLVGMRRLITPRTKVIYISNPNNPTGTIVHSGQVAGFMDSLPDETIVVFDEAYYEYVTAEDFPQTVPDYLKKGRNVLILRTFSKIYGLAGLRIGYGLGQAELVDYLERVRPPFNVSSLAQEAALAALKDTKHVARSVQANEDGKTFLYNGLGRLGLSYVPTSANFVFFDAGGKASDVADHLMRRGVIVRPMEGWGFPTCIRVTIGTEDENHKFINALEEVTSL